MENIRKLMASIQELDFEVDGLEGKIETSDLRKIIKDLKDTVKEMRNKK